MGVVIVSYDGVGACVFWCVGWMLQFGEVGVSLVGGCVSWVLRLWMFGWVIVVVFLYDYIGVVELGDHGGRTA